MLRCDYHRDCDCECDRRFITSFHVSVLVLGLHVLSFGCGEMVAVVEEAEDRTG